MRRSVKNGGAGPMRWLWVLVGALVGAVWTPAVAQRAGDGATDLGFGGVELPVDLVVGELTLQGRRAWVWRVAEPTGPATIRVLLDGEVKTVIGLNRLHAERVSLWLRPIGVGGVGDASGVYEVFGFYEYVESPGGPAAFGFMADELPVQALIASLGPVRMSVDLRSSGRPDADSDAGEFDRRAVEAFGLALETIRDPEGVRRRVEEEAEPALAPPAWLLNRERLRREAEPEAGAGADEDDIVEQPDGEATDAGEVGIQEPVPDDRVREARAEPRQIPFRSDRRAGDRAEPARRRAGATRPSTGVTAADRSPPRAGAAGEPSSAASGDPADPGRVGVARGPARIFSSEGVFFFSAGEWVVERGEDSNALTLTGGVVVQHEGRGRTVEMTARRAVVFLSPGPLVDVLGDFEVSDVLGVYLESGVRVSDGSYTLRSPRVYYDVQADRAVLLDAVFRTYDQRTRMPLYMRAAVIRQESSQRFSAEKAVYANTAFATPHLAVGTSTMTIESRREAGDSSYHVDARGITLRGGGVPFFYFPRYKGDPERFPLRTIGIEDTNRVGTIFRTSWDPFALLGIEPPDGLSAAVDIDYYVDRGLGLGLGAGWSGEGYTGDVRGVILPNDDGTDVMRTGTEIERDGDVRAFAAFRHRWNFRPNWVVQLDGFHASDERVLPALYRDIGVDTDEMTTRLYLLRQENDTALTLEAKGLTTDFLPNEHAAQSPGYAVDKLPELGFTRIGDDLLESIATGYLTHTWSAEAAQMRIRLQEVTPAALGLTNSTGAFRAFGQARSGDPISDVFRAAGYDESLVNRFDTRHEFSSALSLGPVKIRPFVVGRLTAYDTDFSAFSPDESDETRLWGAAGVTLSTSIYRIDESVESRTFDLHRMRHIIEPSVTLWHAESTIDQSDLPVYDDDVEGLADGSAIQLALRQTWQTKRGAPGRWRTVDVFTLDVEYGWFSDDVDEETPIGRFYATRPELSSPDEFIRVSGTWQLTEVIGITGETVWDVEDEREDRNAAGLLVQHSDRLRSVLQIRQIESQNDTYGDAWLSGLFGDKYEYAVSGSYNFRLQDFQTVALTLLRRFPNGMLGGSISYNNISGETSFGVVIRPTGVRGGAMSGQGSLFGG